MEWESAHWQGSAQAAEPQLRLMVFERISDHGLPVKINLECVLNFLPCLVVCRVYSIPCSIQYLSGLLQV